MNTPEHETAQEVAEFLGLTYVPGMGAFDPDGRAVYMDDTTYLMSEEDEEKNQRYREQQYTYQNDLTREGTRAYSKLMWRDAGTKIMRFAFWGSRRVLDLHQPGLDRNRNLTLREWKNAKSRLAQLDDNT